MISSIIPPTDIAKQLFTYVRTHSIISRTPYFPHSLLPSPSSTPQFVFPRPPLLHPSLLLAPTPLSPSFRPSLPCICVWSILHQNGHTATNHVLPRRHSLPVSIIVASPPHSGKLLHHPPTESSVPLPVMHVPLPVAMFRQFHGVEVCQNVHIRDYLINQIINKGINQ